MLLGEHHQKPSNLVQHNMGRLNPCTSGYLLAPCMLEAHSILQYQSRSHTHHVQECIYRYMACSHCYKLRMLCYLT